MTIIDPALEGRPALDRPAVTRSTDVRPAVTRAGEVRTVHRRRDSRLAGVPVVRIVTWIVLYALSCLVIGLLAGIFWSQAVDLPSYTIDDGFVGRMGERELAKIFWIDAWGTGLGVVIGLGLGWLCWRWLSRLGWPCALIAALGGLAAGLIATVVAHFFGPGPLDARIAAASPGDRVPIEFALHTRVVYAVWIAFAVVPVMVGSMLAKEDDGWIHHVPSAVPTAPPAPSSEERHADNG